MYQLLAHSTTALVIKAIKLMFFCAVAALHTVRCAHCDISLQHAKDLAEEFGMEVLVLMVGPLKTGAGVTRLGQQHISFSSSKPFISNLTVPGGPGLAIAAVLAGTGGPLTTPLENPEQGSQETTVFLETVAEQACIVYSNWLQVSGSCQACTSSLLTVVFT
jgi:hypothetical protein